jgi:hypothetical protein
MCCLAKRSILWRIPTNTAVFHNSSFFVFPKTKPANTLISSTRKGASQFDGRFFQKRHHNLADPFKAFLYFLIDFLDFSHFPSISLVKNRPNRDVFSLFLSFLYQNPILAVEMYNIQWQVSNDYIVRNDHPCNFCIYHFSFFTLTNCGENDTQQRNRPNCDAPFLCVSNWCI